MLGLKVPPLESLLFKSFFHSQSTFLNFLGFSNSLTCGGAVFQLGLQECRILGSLISLFFFPLSLSIRENKKKKKLFLLVFS